MNYAQIRKFDIANGPGVRTTLFVTGCTHNCKNCFNREYMDPNFGQPFTKETEKLLIDYLHDDKVRGLSILGGEPFQNEVGLIKFLTRLRRETPKEIWIYSGYTFQEIMAVPIKRELLELCDVLVDGRFVDELKNLKLKFRGSSNQRIIDIKKSLSENRVVLYGNYNE